MLQKRKISFDNLIFSHFELQLKHKIAETFHQKVVFKFCQNIPARKEIKYGGKNTSGK